MRPRVSFQDGAEAGTGLGGITGWHICDGSRHRRTGFSSGQHGGPGRSRRTRDRS